MSKTGNNNKFAFENYTILLFSIKSDKYICIIYY